MSTWLSDLKKSDPKLAHAYGIVGNQSETALRNMVSALSSLNLLNTREDNERLAAARYILSKNVKRKKNPIDTIRQNIMGTISFNGKFAGMKKPQDFIVYPIKSGEPVSRVLIQSDTRIGYLQFDTGEILLSKPHSGGAYAPHLIEAAPAGRLTGEELLNIKAAIMSSASGRAGKSGVMFTDNAGALDVFGSNPSARRKKPIGARSQITKKPPTARLKKRRAKNTEPGYFPNPAFSMKQRDDFLTELTRAITGAGIKTKFADKMENKLAAQARLSFAQGLALAGFILGVFTAAEHNNILIKLDALRNAN